MPSFKAGLKARRGENSFMTQKQIIELIKNKIEKLEPQIIRFESLNLYKEAQKYEAQKDILLDLLVDIIENSV